MVRNLAASRALSRFLLACSLALLALAFAMEAKMAWYGAGAGPGSDIRSAKALPIDAPKLVSHGIPTPDPIHPQLAFAFLAFLALAVPAWTDLHSARTDARNGFQVSLAYFYPQLFFRPPPIL